MYRIVEGGPPPFPENASPELKSFLSQCFEKDPTMRPSADVLFEHDWVKPHLAMNKVRRFFSSLLSILSRAYSLGSVVPSFFQLRPQDSIPFLRRVSADMENLKGKEALSRASLPPPERPFERTYSVPTPVASPTRSPTVSGLPSPVKIPSRASESTLVGGRQSQETARRPAILQHSMTMPIPVPASEVQDLEYDRPLQEHRFVKSTFSKGESNEEISRVASSFGEKRSTDALFLFSSISRHLQDLCRSRSEVSSVLRRMYSPLPRRLCEGRSDQLRSSSSDARVDRFVRVLPLLLSVRLIFREISKLTSICFLLRRSSTRTPPTEEQQHRLQPPSPLPSLLFSHQRNQQALRQLETIQVSYPQRNPLERLHRPSTKRRSSPLAF